MFAEYKVTELFYMADDFYKFFDTILVKICSDTTTHSHGS